MQLSHTSVERQAFYEILVNFGCGFIICDSHFNAYLLSNNLDNILPELFQENSLEDYSEFVQQKLLPNYERTSNRAFVIQSLPGLSFSIHPLFVQISKSRFDSIYAIVIFPDRSAGRIMKHWTNDLTKREKQICGLIIRGFDNKQIAAELAISEHTGKRHLENIYKKLGVSRRKELIDLLIME
jgi:DNA-binding CsgD family transcriptional regulator